MRQWQFATLAVLLAVISILLALPAFASDRARRTWEYRIEGIADRELLPKLAIIGGAGWEIAFARRAIAGEATDSTARYEIIFKRQK